MPQDTAPTAFMNSSKLHRACASLAMAFGISAGPAAAQNVAAIGAEETLWKANIVDAVLSLRACPETGVCGKIHWVNPKDTDAYDYFGDPAVRRERRATEDDIKSLCGFSPKMQFHQVAANRWEGRMEARGQNITFNMDATLVDDQTLKVVASKAIFSKRDTWTRVAADDPRYPKCMPTQG